MISNAPMCTVDQKKKKRNKKNEDRQEDAQQKAIPLFQGMLEKL